MIVQMLIPGGAMANTTPRIDAVIADLDALNATDPRLETDCDRQRPRELVYAERMTACLARVYPDASENLRIAARAQHVCRWQIVRSGFPLGRDGYNAWRVACRQHHATLAVRIMQRHGYGSGDIQQVAKIIKKEDLKRDGESQALENVAAVVFVQFYMRVNFFEFIKNILYVFIRNISKWLNINCDYHIFNKIIPAGCCRCRLAAFARPCGH